MCIHPEAIRSTKNFCGECVTNYHEPLPNDTHDLPDKGYWVVRNSSYYDAAVKENLKQLQLEN